MAPGEGALHLCLYCMRTSDVTLIISATLVLASRLVMSFLQLQAPVPQSTKPTWDRLKIDPSFKVPFPSCL